MLRDAGVEVVVAATMGGQKPHRSDGVMLVLSATVYYEQLILALRHGYEVGAEFWHLRVVSQRIQELEVTTALWDEMHLVSSPKIKCFKYNGRQSVEQGRCGMYSVGLAIRVTRWCETRLVAEAAHCRRFCPLACQDFSRQREAIKSSCLFSAQTWRLLLQFRSR